MQKSLLPRIALIAAAGLVLAGCKTYPEPSIIPSAGPEPPPGVIDLYRALKPVDLPAAWPTGTFPGVTMPATGYIPGQGVLLTTEPTKDGLADGLYLGYPQTGRERLVVPISPGRERDIATASALGQDGIAYQVGPESGPRNAPVELAAVTGGKPAMLRLPPGDLRSIDTSFHFEGHELIFLSTRSLGDNDLTSVVACHLPSGSCRDLFREQSSASSLDVIAIGTDTHNVYLALKPADPEDKVQGDIVEVPIQGGRPRTLWRTAGILTSMVPGAGLLAFTEDFGVDEGLYLREGKTMIRITPPGVFPSNPSYGNGYLAFWANSPELLDIRADRLYRIPGQMPELYGDLLTYVTPQGLRWVQLPPTGS